MIARSGNTLTLSGSTLDINNYETTCNVYGQVTCYNNAPTQLLVAPGTLVSADDSTATGLNYNSISVGQYVSARGIYELPASGVGYAGRHGHLEHQHGFGAHPVFGDLGLAGVLGGR